MKSNSSPRKIEEVLNSLTGIKRAEPQPFFYTRVRARLEAAHFSLWDKVSTLISKPSIAFMGVFLVVVINLFAIYSHNTTVSSTDLSDVASNDEYSVVNSTFYDIENNKP